MQVRLNPEEREALEYLYVKYGITTDGYDKNPNALRELTDEFNAVTGRNGEDAVLPGDLLRYMYNRRKHGKEEGRPWPRLGRRKDTPTELPDSPLSPDERQRLVQVYTQNGVAVDNYSFDANLREQLVETMMRECGRAMNGSVLVAELKHLRKIGVLSTFDGRKQDKKMPFGDIDAVGA